MPRKYQKSKRSKRTTFQCLGDNILTNILSRLPAELVLQCRRVCKRWRNLTSASDFIELQHKLAKPVLLVEYDRQNTKLMLSTDDESAELAVTPVCRYMTYLLNQEEFFEPEIMSSCHGLILYRDVTSKNSIYHDHFICNPVTHQKITIPSKMHEYVCGFYFHPLTKEHRVLHHFQRVGENHHNYSIYSLEKNSWRDLSCISHDEPSLDNPIIVNESLHWFADAEEKSGDASNYLCANLILRFNINSETIDTIPHPEHQSCSENHNFDYDMQLVEANEKLCLFHLVTTPDVVINGWILDSNNKEWVKTYTLYAKWIFRDYSFPFSVSDYNIRIFGINNSEMLLLWEDFGLFSCDIQKGIVYEIEVDEECDILDILESPRTIFYKKSLVSLKHFLEVLKGEQAEGTEWETNSLQGDESE